MVAAIGKGMKATAALIDKMTNVLSVGVTYAPSGRAIVFACAAFALTLMAAIPPAVRAARLEIVDAVAVD